MSNHTIRTVYQCNLQILTPVHVGSGEKLVENFDFFGKDNKIYVISSAKLFATVEKLGADKIMEFTRVVEDGDIATWLQKQDIRPDKIASCSFKFPWQKTPSEIHAHIRDAFGNPLIPGSSLKGALRTAIIRKVMKAEDDFQVRIKGSKPKYMDQIICGELLGRDPKENLLRTLSVGDYRFQPDHTSIQQVWVHRLKSKTNLAGKFPIHIEGIRANAASQGIISFDEFLNDKDNEEKCFKFKARLSLPWLLDACRSLTRHTIETELQFLEGKAGRPVDGLRRFYTGLSGQIKNLPENEVIIQMGWGSGWRGMTGQLLESADLSANLRKELRLADKYLSFPFPKSRRLTLVNGTDSPMGWIKLSFIPMEGIKKAEQERQRQQISLQKERQQREAEEQRRQEAEAKRRAEWETMSPEERDIARLSMPDVSDEEVGAIFNRIDSFSPEKKIEVARKIKEWRIKKNIWTGQKKAQLKKVRKIKQILGEA
ncbi:MAG: type III-A CRISPR-associated RAMP protein Csm5 [Deltaproteobacteria bacterium]|nr:type III-A CRISPR-associated RAMP protein Csm5 [Deltaproteobacteria bacterium]MBW2020960.1 type III-A CRISPR-associated RAMP protein Csm5 [Deltaproteobacteria bacterium]MBW2098668.1 type III-A CRISPR-associated RAMP protein Csm5 [Deltaproteobacteria bacterium]